MSPVPPSVLRFHGVGAIARSLETNYPGVFHRLAGRTKTNTPATPVLPSGSRLLEPETRQPCFHFEDPVALDFEGPTVADPNVVVPGILGDRDLEGRSQLLQEETPVARNFFDSGSDPRTVLSVIGYPKQRQCTNKRRRETNGETMLLRENPFKLLLTPCRALRYSSNTNG